MMDKDIVSTKEEDKPLIYISEEAINLKRDNDKYKKEIKKLKRHIKAINEWIDNNIETGNIYCYDTTPFPKLEE